MRVFLAMLGVTATATATATASCTSAIVASYADLFNYAPATAFCADTYPNFTTSAVVTTCMPGSGQNYARSPPPRGRPDADLPRPGLRPQDDDDEEELFHSLMHQSDATVSAVCSCISSLTTRYQTISCAPWEYCSASGQCQMNRDCQNPARCDSDSYCGTNAAGMDMFCHFDADVSDSGYCMGDGPSGRGCPEEYEDCSANSDCGSDRVCIYACCRKEPFCVDVRDYKGLPKSPQSPG